MTEKEKLYYISDYMSQSLLNYSKARREKERAAIERELQDFVDQHIDGDLYMEFINQITNDKLFKHGFFEVDLRRALSLLDEKIKQC